MSFSFCARPCIKGQRCTDCVAFVDSKSRPGGAARACIQIFKTYTVSWRQEGHRFHPKGFLVMWRISRECQLVTLQLGSRAQIRVPEPGIHPFGDFQIQICTECPPVSLLWQKDAESSIRFFLRHRTKALFFLSFCTPACFWTLRSKRLWNDSRTLIQRDPTNIFSMSFLHKKPTGFTNCQDRPEDVGPDRTGPALGSFWCWL